MGTEHVLALTSVGAVVSWGSSAVGAVGAVGHEGFAPGPIPRLAAVHAIYTGWRRSFAVLENGAIRIWGTPVPEFARPSGHRDISPFPMPLLVKGVDR